MNRLHRVLEEAGLQLATVMSDVTALAELARWRLRQKIPALRLALAGPFRPHHAFLIGQILAKVDFLEETIATLTDEIDRQVRPFEALIERLTSLPGVARRSAVTIIAETGADMSRFPTAGHLCSWGAMCPGHNESGGKRRSGKTRDGNHFLRAALIESALAATRAKGTALQARYFRIKRHRGHQKAVVAVGHQILEIAYYIMRDPVTYQELGSDYFARRDPDRATRRHVKQLEALSTTF